MKSQSYISFNFLSHSVVHITRKCAHSTISKLFHTLPFFLPSKLMIFCNKASDVSMFRCPIYKMEYKNGDYTCDAYMFRFPIHWCFNKIIIEKPVITLQSIMLDKPAKLNRTTTWCWCSLFNSSMAIARVSSNSSSSEDESNGGSSFGKIKSMS